MNMDHNRVEIKELKIIFKPTGIVMLLLLISSLSSQTRLLYHAPPPYAEVGKDIPVYATVPLRTIGTTNSGGTIGSANQATFAPREGETLRPERQKAFEIGTDG